MKDDLFRTEINLKLYFLYNHIFSEHREKNTPSPSIINSQFSIALT